MTGFAIWLLLLIFCWPAAILAIVLYPFVWLLLLPFRILGIAVDVQEVVVDKIHEIQLAGDVVVVCGLGEIGGVYQREKRVPRGTGAAADVVPFPRGDDVPISFQSA